jgi:hypothetical protein
MTRSQRQRAENEVVFRQHNNAVRDVAKAVLVNDNAVDVSLEFICECSNENCRDTVRVPISEYEKIRSNNREFVIAPGHEHTDIEKVIHGDGYVVVEKFEEPPHTADRLHKTE